MWWKQGENSTVVVLADGLGSGVKASILSTLTAKIISTMMAEGLSVEDCVATIAATLPVCSVRGVAYSTFTIVHIVDNNETAQIIEYDNPQVIMMRDGDLYDYPRRPKSTWAAKPSISRRLRCSDGDMFIAMSDGCPHAGLGERYNFGWKREDIVDFMVTFSLPWGIRRKRFPPF